MTKAEVTAAYQAYAELEAAAEAFYAAADKMMKACPETMIPLSTICEDVNCAIIHVDDKLDEVI